MRRNHLSIVLEVWLLFTWFRWRVLSSCTIKHFFNSNSVSWFHFLSQIEILAIYSDTTIIHVLNNELIFWFIRYFFNRNNFLSKCCLLLLIHSLFKNIFFNSCKWILIGNIDSRISLCLWCFHINMYFRFILIRISMSSSRNLPLLY